MAASSLARSWSAESATRAYLRTVTSGSTSTKAQPAEPNAAEFISALAAGTAARLIVEARSSPAGPTTLALLAAAHQTPGARVVCILSDPAHLHPSILALGLGCNYGPDQLVEFVVGDARTLVMNEYRGADFVLVDCEMEGVFEAAVQVNGGGLVVGCKAFKHCCNYDNKRRGVMGTLLPIGDGLRVCRVAAEPQKNKKSRWVKRVDECTGEEHVYRITASRTKLIG